MKSCLIISGGDYCKIENSDKYSVIIACDKGLSYARQSGINPNIIIGDFDSYDEEDLNDILNNKTGYKDAKLMTYPSRKDDTDTMLAIREALNNNCTDITITCALGGRMDHTISNIQSMVYAVQNGAGCQIISETEILRVYMADKKAPIAGKNIEIEKIDGYSLSLFSISDECKNLTIQNAKYETDNITLTNRFPLGVSNGFNNNSVHISFTEGILLVVMSKI